ncbi:MAG: glycoside hydrolase [Cyclobacteriaceae bacterium]|nr:glycoside hydrolase [Cyclobacteriaceae bacterium]
MKHIFFYIIGVFGVACSVNTYKNDKIGYDEPVILSDSTKFSQAVFLTKDNYDNPVIVWSSADIDSGQYVLNFRHFDKQQETFGEIQKIEQTRGMQAHHESMAKIAVKQNGDILAVYRRENTASSRRFAGDLFYVESADNGATWSDESKFVTDTTSASQSFYDLARLANGEIGVTWLDSRKLEKDEGSSIFFKQTSSFGGFREEVAVQGSTCQCCRTEIEVDTHGKLNIAFRDIINDSIRDMVYVYSEDNGNTFSKGKRISADNWMIKGCPHTGPTIATNDTQRATAWFTMGGGKGVYFTVGINSQDSSPTRMLIDKNATHPQMIWAKNHFYLTYELRLNNNKGKAYRQIVITKIDKDGKVNETIYVSEPSIDSQMPVIAQVDDSSLMVSWVEQRIEHKSVIKAKLILLE